MPEIAYGVGAYRRDVAGLPEIRLVNQFVEAPPQSGGQPVLIGRPGLVSDSVTAGVVRGLFRRDGVCGSALVAVADEVRVGGLSVGATGGSGLVRFAPGGDDLLLVDDGGLFRVTASAVTAVTFPAAAVSDIAFVSGRFLAAEAGSGRVYWSALLDCTAWDALDFATAESQTDPLVALLAVGDFVWLFGGETVEVWASTGDGETPFAPVEGRVSTVGCRARDTVVLLDNAPYWVTQDGQVVRGGDVPRRVSNHGVEERISASSSGDLSAFCFGWQGHLFYCLRTAVGTMVLDVSTGEWAEWSSLGRPWWRPWCGAMDGWTVYVGASDAGVIWRLDGDAFTDDGVELERVATGLLPVASGAVRLDSLNISAIVGRAGSGVDPVVEMRKSSDGGNTWSSWRPASLGRQGSYRTRVCWRRLGIADFPGAVFELRVTDAAPWRLSGMRVNAMPGGRGR